MVSHSLQRAEHGEQPVWMGAVLAAALGQIGLPGGGYGYALGAIGYYGRRYNAVPVPTLSQGRNGVADFIPVARIADMLLNPGTTYRYNGQTRTYPDIRLVYWAGGNPFHHHQDLNRLRRAFAQVDTLVVHELGWTATARHADFVLPCTMTLEREDIGAQLQRSAAGRHAPPWRSRSARRATTTRSSPISPSGSAPARPSPRDAACGSGFEHLYEPTRAALAELSLPAPTFDEFWAGDGLDLPQHPDDGGRLRQFRDDPDGHPLPTPSGKTRDLLGDSREFRGARLSGPSDLAGAGRRAARGARR